MAAGWKKFTGVSQYPELTSNKEGSAFTYGSKRDRPFRMGWIQGRRNEQEESQVIDWLNYVTSSNISNNDPLEALSDGKILCKLILRLNPRALERPINQKPALFSSTDNVDNFLTSLENLGFQKDELFPPNALLERKDLSAVIGTLQLVRSRYSNA